MRRQFVFLAAAFTLAANMAWAQTKSDEVILTIKEINIVGTQWSEKSIRRLLTFQEGDSFTEDTLEKKIYTSRVVLQNDSNIYLAEFEYEKKGSEVYVELMVYDATMGFSFSAFSTGPIVKYRNLLTEGFDVGTHMGYSRQMLFMDWKRIGGLPVGFYLLSGHQIFNPFESEYMTSSYSNTARLYFWLGPHIKLGLLDKFNFTLGGWEDAQKRQTNAIGGSLEANYYYLLDIIKFGFSLKADYLYHHHGNLNKAHSIRIRGKTIFRPFNTNRVTFNLGTHINWASNDLIDREKISLSKNSGRAAWDLEFFVPVHLIKISGGANFYIGLEPGVIVGKGGTDNFDFSNPEIGISFAPILQVGFPASVFFAPRFVYNISEKRLTFTFGFSSLPYTKELDMDW